MTPHVAPDLAIDRTLRRVVVLFRLLAFVWMGALVAATLATDTGASKPWVALAIAVAALLTGATVIVGRERRLLASTWWLAADGIGAVFLSVSPSLAEAEDLFYGGMPLSWLLLVVYAHSKVWVAAVATLVLAGAQVINAEIGVRVITATQIVGRVLVFAVSAAVYGWAFFEIRRSYQKRAIAEAERDEERRHREIADERAQIATRLHDSVLQTLALVRQGAADPERVVTLARRQERDLRSWIDRMSSEFESSFRAAMRDMAAELEEVCGIEIDGVYVADANLDAALEALLMATREALMNVAKHAGVAEASLFSEVRNGDARVVVKDRGQGFDPDSAGGTGIRKSMRERLERHGGTVSISSKPGRGTEVELCVPRGGSDD